MLKFCHLTKQAFTRSSCIIKDGARTLSVLQNKVPVFCSNYGCVDHHENRPDVEPQPSRFKGQVGRRLLTGFPPGEARRPYTDIHTNGDKGQIDRASYQHTSVDENTEFFHFYPTCLAETIASVSSSFTVVPDMVTEAEEAMLMKEVEPHLKRLKYEFDHWDDAIHGFREVERSRWSQQISCILDRICKTAFPDTCQQLPQTHVLDLAKSGVIKPHVDSVRFCGNTISGLCLLSDAVMRLRHVKLEDQVVDVLVKRRSLYIMSEVNMK
ncbi:alpha-ketoglutarate-dependent dioxygenase alkB homolog 7, mitochondrial-like isoform X2 [Portunus trituberculatus]|uniref:alpha-ketoglutarate-dependent dioxygenase alkB homolog 7, mitochondrial-like isoform X2 n=1 Tax=Portunus trituberculatus TaxID=210409 RepID=UPI001E1CE6AF|nr:alpha-ketoglutarate-dependent dioxygenase alkB homolog 7, mitochondrial-like isoform X2 [Portunus trituberculatus]